MTALEKLLKVTTWSSTIFSDDTGQLAPQADAQRIDTIVKLIGEPFPEEIITLYRAHDGDTGSGSSRGH